MLCTQLSIQNPIQPNTLKTKNFRPNPTQSKPTQSNPWMDLTNVHVCRNRSLSHHGDAKISTDVKRPPQAPGFAFWVAL